MRRFGSFGDERVLRALAAGGGLPSGSTAPTQNQASRLTLALGCRGLGVSQSPEEALIPFLQCLGSLKNPKPQTPSPKSLTLNPKP